MLSRIIVLALTSSNFCVYVPSVGSIDDWPAVCVMARSSILLRLLSYSAWLQPSSGYPALYAELAPATSDPVSDEGCGFNADLEPFFIIFFIDA